MRHAIDCRICGGKFSCAYSMVFFLEGGLISCLLHIARVIDLQRRRRARTVRRQLAIESKAVADERFFFPVVVVVVGLGRRRD
jgi:hypothetical protein